VTKLPRPDQPDFREVAIGLLARREHSAQELRSKLSARGCEADQLDDLLSELASEGLQSDDRYAESYVHSRIARGFGPLKIQAELRQRGVSDRVIDHYLDPRSADWRERARGAWEKKFGEAAGDYRERTRQARFLQGRGFASDTISQILNDEWD